MPVGKLLRFVEVFIMDDDWKKVLDKLATLFPKDALVLLEKLKDNEDIKYVLKKAIKKEPFDEAGFKASLEKLLGTKEGKQHLFYSSNSSNDTTPSSFFGHFQE